MISGQDTPLPREPEKAFVFSASRLAPGLRFFGDCPAAIRGGGRDEKRISRRAGDRRGGSRCCLAGAPPAQAQVGFRGSFPLPHGRLSIGFGDPHFRVGSYAPFSYRVYAHPRYGYGYRYRSRWIPVRRYRSRWIVVARPVVVEPYYTDFGYFRDGYPGYAYFGYGYPRYGYSGFHR